MQKSFSKAQIGVIIALNCLIVLLLCGIFFIPGILDRTAGTEPEEHDKYRDARISLNAHLDFENNLGGSGNEQLIACFPSPDQEKIHIFGNTSSDDFDFEDETGGIFYIITDRKAKILKIVTFGSEKDTLVKVELANRGYVLGIDDSEKKAPYLLLIDYEGNITKTITHTATSEERLADIQLMPEGYLMVISAGNSVLQFYSLKVLIYDLEFQSSVPCVLTDASYSQEYVCVFEKGESGYLMAVNLKSDRWNGMGVIEFEPNKSPRNVKVELENNYMITGFMPVSGGYLALTIDVDGRASLLTINRTDYKPSAKDYISYSATGGKLFFENGNYYAFVSTHENSIMKKYSYNPNVQTEMAIFEKVDRVDWIFVTDAGAVFSCVSGGSVTLIGIHSETFVKKFGGGNERNVILIRLKNDFFSICESAAKSNDVGNNFGGRDIWIAKTDL